MTTRTLITAGLLIFTATAGGAQDFDWSGRLGDGQTLEIRGVNGAIEVLPSSDGRAHVEAEKRGRRSDPATVRIEVVEHGGGVTICAVYPTPSDERRENDCRPGGGRNNTGRNDVEVQFTVRVPDGVDFSGHTVNGRVSVDGIEGDVDAGTVNGDVEIQTRGFAQANTVNGDIRCRLGQVSLEEDVEFETVNGSITLEMPEGLNADFHASTVNGSIESDFPILVRGRVNRRSLQGAIGDGGPNLRASTVNGSIRLRRL